MPQAVDVGMLLWSLKDDNGRIQERPHSIIWGLVFGVSGFRLVKGLGQEYRLHSKQKSGMCWVMER